MLNLQHLGKMRQSAKALGLGLGDTRRWLWSYYASRFPGAQVHDVRPVQITIGDGVGKGHSLFIRNNGYDWDVVDEIFVRHAYRVDVPCVSRILDLGGNIGVATLWFAWNFPGGKICTVEPIPDNLSVLRRNIQVNGAPAKVVAAAAGAEDGKTRFAMSEDPRQHSTSIDVLRTERTVEVDVLSVPTLLTLMGWKDVDLLKIDVEGAEREILGGRPEWLRKVRCILGEGHVGVGYTIDACRRDLEPMGFRVQELDRNEGAILFLARRPD